MKDLVKKVAVGLATGALVAQAMVLPSFAELTVVVTGNGSDSDNKVDLDRTNTTTVTQTNTANVSNHVDAHANSGGNEAKGNTGGDVSIDTGSAKAEATVSNVVNSNEARVDCNGCPTDLSVRIDGNGSKSYNQVDLDLKNTTWVTQDNDATIKNKVDVSANSGDNKVKDTTGGDVSIDTGWAKAKAIVDNKANANIASVGNGSRNGALDLVITGNGYDSDNKIDLDSSNTIGVTQTNLANISNDVYVDANSGDNDAKDNTGGSASIDTGTAWAGAKVDNLANFNWADVEGCCQLDGLVKIAGNGSDSDSNVSLDLTQTLYVTQDNDFGCGKDHFRELDLVEFLGRRRHQDCNKVDASANSGDNDLKDSTGSVHGDPTITTGSAATQVEVDNTGNSNVFATGDAVPTPPPDSWPGLDGNGGWVWWFLSGHSAQ